MSGLESENWIRIFGGNVVEEFHGSLASFVEGGLVAVSDINEGDAGSGLHVASSAKSGFIVNDHVWDVLSGTELWKPHDKLNWIDITGDADEFSLTVLNQIGDVVKTESEVLSGSGWGVTTGSFGLKSLSLLLSGLWGIILQQVEKMFGYLKIWMRKDNFKGRI